MTKKTLKEIEGTRFHVMVVKAFTDFINKHGRGPTAIEIDDKDNLFPFTSRTLQRNFGGLQQLRKELGLETINFTKGASRSSKSKEINERGLRIENDLYELLKSKFGEVNVHRQYMYLHDNRSKADFGVFNRKPNHIDIIDIFYPATLHSLDGCLRAKRKKYNRIKENLVDRKHTVWFVCGNPELKVPQNSLAISYQEFLAKMSLQNP